MIQQDNQNTPEKDVSASKSETIQEPLSTSRLVPHKRRATRHNKRRGSNHHTPDPDRIRASLWVIGVVSFVLVLIAYIYLYKRGILPPWLGDLASSVSSVNGLIGGVISGGLVSLILGKTSLTSIQRILKRAYTFPSLILIVLIVAISIAIPEFINSRNLDPYIGEAKLDSNSLKFSAYSWLDDGANCSPSDQLNISGTTTHFHGLCFAQDTDYSNFIFQVTMQIISGNCGGIALRADSGSRQEYVFSVCPYGDSNPQYYFYRYDKGGPASRTIAHNTSPFIHEGQATSNVIAVQAKGSKFVLYINGKSVDDVHDSTYSEGQIGLTALSRTGSAYAVFSDPRIWVFS